MDNATRDRTQHLGARTTMTELRQKAQSALRQESADLLAWAWSHQEQANCEALLPGLEDVAGAATERAAALREELAQLEGNREGLQRELAAMEARRQAAYDAIRQPMLSSGVFYADGSSRPIPRPRPDPAPDLPSASEVDDLKDGLQGLDLQIRRTSDALEFQDKQAQHARKSAAGLRNKLDLLASAERPATPCWDEFLSLVGVEARKR